MIGSNTEGASAKALNLPEALILEEEEDGSALLLLSRHSVRPS